MFMLEIAQTALNSSDQPFQHRTESGNYKMILVIDLIISNTDSPTGSIGTREGASRMAAKQCTTGNAASVPTGLNSSSSSSSHFSFLILQRSTPPWAKMSFSPSFLRSITEIGLCGHHIPSAQLTLGGHSIATGQ